MNEQDYKKVKIRMVFFDETDVVQTSACIDGDWKDENADDNGWT